MADVISNILLVLGNKDRMIICLNVPCVSYVF